jgi:hypothetical protein
MEILVVLLIDMKPICIKDSHSSFNPERGHPFFRHRILTKKVCSQKLTVKGKRRPFVRSFTKKNQKVLIKIEEMAEVFLNLANFAPHAFLTLGPPSGYALNIKSLIKVTKVS